MKIVLTIGATDPTSGAGIQMDLKVFHALGIYGLSIITAVTSQSTKEFSLIYPLPEKVIVTQFETILKDIKPHGAKTGVLYSKKAVKCVVDYVKKFNIKNFVVDPVIISTTGAKLVEDEALKILKEELIPVSKVTTANTVEAETITGIKIKKIDDIYKSAEKLRKMGTEIAIVKGGHFPEAKLKVPDILYDGNNFYTIESERIYGEFHGTGCAFSSAFVSFICSGYEPVEAFKASKNFVKKAIENSLKLGHGINLLMISKEAGNAGVGN